MNSDLILPGLIEVSYGAAEKSRYLAFDATKLHLEQAAEAGSEILRRSKSLPGACTYLTAMWAAMLRDNLGLPAYCVAGDLYVRGRMAFGSTDPNIAPRLGESSDAWDGHCWLALGRYVGDISVFRTAYAQPRGSNLRQAVLDEFGPGRGLLLMRRSDALTTGVDYRPKYVARESEITALIKGAHAAGKL
jgi:hypothetical protein